MAVSDKNEVQFDKQNLNHSNLAQSSQTSYILNDTERAHLY